MTHHIETMAYANEVPWHGLGNNVDAKSTPLEMAKAAGLDWTVELRPLYTKTSKGKEIKIGLRRALVRSSDNKVMTITGDYWKPVQNVEAMEFFKDYCESGGARMETAGALHGGKVIWGLANINKGFTVKGSKKDTIGGYILLVWRHMVGTSTEVRTCATRVVCANTMAMAEREGMMQYRQSHTTRLNITAARERVQLAMDQIALLEKQANLLAKQKLSEQDSVKFLAKFFAPAPEGVSEDAHAANLLNNPTSQPKKFQDIMNSLLTAPGAVPGTAWGVLNGVTHYIDHVAGKNPDARLFNAWLGDRAKTKQEVFSGLLELAGGV